MNWTGYCHSCVPGAETMTQVLVMNLSWFEGRSSDCTSYGKIWRNKKSGKSLVIVFKISVAMSNARFSQPPWEFYFKSKKFSRPCMISIGMGLGLSLHFPFLDGILDECTDIRGWFLCFRCLVINTLIGGFILFSI